jgi:hypothetical protein
MTVGYLDNLLMLDPLRRLFGGTTEEVGDEELDDDNLDEEVRPITLEGMLGVPEESVVESDGTLPEHVVNLIRNDLDDSVRELRRQLGSLHDASEELEAAQRKYDRTNQKVEECRVALKSTAAFLDHSKIDGYDSTGYTADGFSHGPPKSWAERALVVAPEKPSLGDL